MFYNLRRLEADGVLTRLHTAFSRDGGGEGGEGSEGGAGGEGGGAGGSERPDGKVYVQQRLREWGAPLCRLLLDERGHLYVCGDGARMAQDVHAALLAIVAKERGVDADAARGILEGLKSEGRYLREIWS